MTPPPLDALAALPGVSGLVFHRGLEIVNSILPETWGASSVRTLCRAVINGFSGYASSGRQATQCWFEFPEACVLSLTPPLQENQITRSIARGPDQPQQIAAPFLTFILTDRSVVAEILPPANAFLARQAAIQMDLWLKCREDLLRILSKSVPLHAAKQLLAEVLEAEHLPPQASVAPADFRLLGETLIRRTPDPAAQPQMLADLNQALENMLTNQAAIRTRAV
jgi:hypothetical protein